MFDETESRDWLLGAVLVAFAVAGVWWLKVQSGDEQEVVSPMRVAPPPAAASSQEGSLVADPASQALPIARVFECEQNGPRVLSDRACGPDAVVREVTEPNRMDAQDTRGLYRSAPRYVGPSKGAASATGSSDLVCAEIEQEVDAINARMRRGYTNGEGERYRDRLRALSDRRHQARCIR
jgi:hypothetical protein